MDFSEIDKIWKKHLVECMGEDALNQSAYSNTCIKKLEITENLLKSIGQNNITTNLYYNLVSDSITEPIYNLLLKIDDGWFNKDTSIPFENREYFLSNCIIKDKKFDTNFYIHHFQNMKSVGVRTFHEAVSKIDPNYQYEKLLFLRQVGTLLAFFILIVDLEKIALFSRMMEVSNSLHPHAQIDQYIQLTLERDIDLCNEIENIKLGKNNIQYWSEFNSYFGGISDGKKFSINKNLKEEKSSNFFKKIFLID